jgi:peptidyl-prolyl cis-trans isomerase D
MALIGKIRQRTGLLLGFIGVALLLFLLEAGLSQNNLMSGIRKNVGSINGKKVDTQEYDAAVRAYFDRIKVLNPGLAMTDENAQAVRDEVWNGLIFDQLVGDALKKLGLDVTAEEIAENFKGDNIHPLVQNVFGQSFTNPQTGQFDKAQFTTALGTMDQVDPSGQFRSLVTQVEALLRDERIRTKYTSLIAKGAYVPAFMAKDQMSANKSMMADVLSVPYSSIEDESVKVSDEEIAAYIKKNPARFRQKASRILDIVTFDLKASVEDVEAIRANVLELANEFATTEEDSLFMVRNAVQGSEVKYLTPAEIRQNRPYAEELMATATGAFFGPYEDGQMMVITRIIDRKMIPDSVRASHILLKYTSVEDRNEKMQLADSLIADFKAGRASFPQKAIELSEDQGSKQTGGDLGFFPKDMMVPEFNKAVFYDMNVGDIEKVESQFGLHIIAKTGQQGGQMALRLADIALEIGPSDATSKEIYEKAYGFFQSASSEAEFDKQAKSQSFQRNITVEADAAKVAGMEASRKMVTWAFQEKEKGGVQFFDLDERYAVAKLNSIREEGLSAVEDVKAEVTAVLINEKKAAIITKKLEEAAKASKELESLATKTNGTFIPGIALMYAQDFVSNIGAEPKLVGTAFGIPANAISKPVAGENGVYMVKAGEVESNAVDMDIKPFQTQLASMTGSRIFYTSVIESLKDKAKIKDERFYIY